MAGKALLVGRAPARRMAGRGAFRGRSGERLAALAGTDLDGLLRAVDAANLLGEWPGKQGKGDAFPMAAARAAAGVLDVSGRPLVVAVGKRVAAAMGLRRPEYFAPAAWRGVPLVVVPHPSGVNRWWNDPVNVGKMHAFMRSLLIGEEGCGP